MIVKYFATLRKITGVQEENINAKTVGELLEIIEEKYGKEFHDSIFSGENFKKGVIILKNGKNVIYLDNLNTKLEDNDIVSIFPPVAGG
ncbi:MAG: ubiquitin-like small modifier protein 1 [Thermoplasmata archaeon]